MTSNEELEVNTTSSMDYSSSQSTQTSDAESSDFDETEHNKNCSHSKKEMYMAEHLFSSVSEKLYQEKRTSLIKQLENVKNETDTQFLSGADDMTTKHKKKLTVLHKRDLYHKEMLKRLLEADKLACVQMLQNDKQNLLEQFQNAFDTKVRGLQEDRDEIDINEKYSQYLTQEMVGKDRKKSSNKPLQQSTNSRRKKKVQVVQGACVVYRLKEEEILQDLIAIRKAVAAKKRQNASGFQRRTTHTHSCKIEDSRLHYGGKIYVSGNSITFRKSRNHLSNRGVIARITDRSINVKQSDGKRVRLFAHQLQRGRLIINHCNLNLS